MLACPIEELMGLLSGLNLQGNQGTCRTDAGLDKLGIRINEAVL